MIVTNLERIGSVREGDEVEFLLTFIACSNKIEKNIREKVQLGGKRMELIKLVGILIVILGFAFKLDSILIILLSAIVTAIVGGLGVEGFLASFGSNFVSNRSMAIFIVILLVTGTLERNGLREAAASLIQKMKGVTAGKLICAYGVMRAFFGAFNVGFGGVAGFIRPVVLPMAEGAVEAEEQEINEEHFEEIKGMASAMENITWFFFMHCVFRRAGGYPRF